ncbi:MAG: HAD-IA family hydrolase [bacterium]
MNSLPKVILFDGHGTLTYPKRSTFRIYCELTKKFNCAHSLEYVREQYVALRRKHYLFLQQRAKDQQDVTWEEDRQHWFSLESQVFKDLGIDTDYEQLSMDILTNYMTPVNQKVYSDVPKILHYLTSKGYILGVITNSDSRYKKILHYHGIERYFKYFFISSETKFKKPSKQVYQYASDVIGKPLSSIWYIGDQL